MRKAEAKKLAAAEEEEIAGANKKKAAAAATKVRRLATSCCAFTLGTCDADVPTRGSERIREGAGSQ